MPFPIQTSEGSFLAYYSENGLERLDFPIHREPKGLLKPAELPLPMRQWHTMTTKALEQVLAGHAPEALPPFDLSAGTEFQQRVWNALRRITLGKTNSYAEMAASIGQPKATRAVGSACGANPIPVLIPCHRVLAANHRLGGFSGGLDWKRKLLAREGLLFPD
ncbi:MAG: bifunctional transcriptional activator/DNA repair enzyme protein Ada [Pedosphaera sp.]|nr:bifunctional transcriptional activator/DNA repair enzyme protein Ada [Pedosphaera sp.]